MSQLFAQNPKPLPVIQFSPHAGLQTPSEIADNLLIGQCDIYNDADLWADQHFDFSNPDLAPYVPDGYTSGTLCTIGTPIARVLIDANRLPVLDDNPDGAVKKQTSYGNPIYRRPLTSSEREMLFERYYLSYHRQVKAALQGNLNEAKLLLDCHNMAQVGPSTYANAGEPRPLLCISNVGDRDGKAMTDMGETACPPEMLQFVAEIGTELFCDMHLLEPGPVVDVPTVALNWPFRGGHVMRHYSRIGTPGCRVPMLMIEVNRGLFIGNQHGDSAIAPPNLERIAQVRKRLYQLTIRIVEYVTENNLI